MAQLSKGDTFADGQQLTATRLNQLVDSATITAGAITEQTNITANTVASGDSILLYDLSATALREANVSDVLGSNLPVATSAITAGANSDIVVTPNDATIVVGATYVSANGLTVVVTTATAHGLTVGQVVLISAASAGYNGTFRLTAVTSLTFTYVMTTAATAGSGSFSYTKKATVKNTGNETISGNLYVDGNVVIAGTTNQTNVVITGTTNQTGAVTQSGTLNVTGTATFSTAPVLVTSVIKPRFDYFVQTRTQAILTSGWGGLQNGSNLYGTKITALDLTLTPQKVGNTVVLTWSVMGESTYAEDTLFLVTRTPNSGAGSGVAVALPNSVDASNNTWSGITNVNYDGNDQTTPSTVIVKIVDFNTLDVSCTYSVHFRAANDRTSTFHLNRSVNSAGALDHETGMSLGHAHEIYI